jgi:hypothetical protein
MRRQGRSRDLHFVGSMIPGGVEQGIKMGKKQVPLSCLEIRNGMKEGCKSSNK